MQATLLFVTVLLAAADATPGSDLVSFQAAGKWGFKDAAGKIVVEAKYDKVGAFSSGLAPVNVGAQVDDFLLFNPPMKTGGRWGYIDARGNVVVPVKLDYAREFSDGLARVSDGRGVRYLDPSGRVVVDLGQVSQAGDFCEGVAPVYEDRSLAGKDWQTKFIDKKGRTAFSVDGYAHEFHDGLAVLIVRQEKMEPSVSNERQRYGYIDRTGKVAIPPRFAEALDFHKGLAAVRPKKTTVWGKGDTWGYIDKSGKYIVEPQFNEAHPFHKGIARVHVGGTLQTPMDAIPSWEGGEWRLIDRTGKVLRQSAEWLEYSLGGQTAGEIAANQAEVGQPGPASGDSAVKPVDSLLAKAATALKGVQSRVKEDPILRPLSAAKLNADGPKYVELSTDTPESWDGFPTKSAVSSVGTTRGTGRLRISVYANLPSELPGTPFIPPKGCYWGSTYLHVPGTMAKVLVETVASDPQAQRRLTNVVIKELVKAGITARSPRSEP